MVEDIEQRLDTFNELSSRMLKDITTTVDKIDRAYKKQISKLKSMNDVNKRFYEKCFDRKVPDNNN